MKRLRSKGTEAVLSQDLRAVHDTIAQEDFLGAAALLGLSHRKSQWYTALENDQQDHEMTDPLPASRPESGSAKNVRNVSKAARTSHNTRSYVWRGPHRGALALRKKQLQQEQHILDSGHVSDGTSSRRSSASGAAASDGEEDSQQEQQQVEAVAEGPYASARQRDKEWAALTTWLRMNLHHPRTVKKLVLFVGEQDVSTGSWKFYLNPGLTWDDVSVETKLRLKTLSIEAEQAFLHKYPDRPAAEWGTKVQKYRPAGSSTTVNVHLKDMVASLSSIYFEHEPHEAEQNRTPHLQPAEQPKTDDQQPRQQEQQTTEELHQQQTTQLPQVQETTAQAVDVEQPNQQQVAPPPVLGVPVGLSYMPSAAAAASAVPAMFPGWGYMSAYSHWQTYLSQLQQQQLCQQMSFSAAVVAGVPAVGVPADVAAAGVAAGAASCRQVQPPVMQQAARPSDLPVQKGVLPDVAAGDGTDSCAESATPVAAQTSLAFAAAC